MDKKIEAYLDRVCRGIAGPRSLRAHIREELREHLEEAAAGHVAAGMDQAAALDKALDEFGGPEEVRAELQATHGERWMTVVVDQAMAWKEKTMKARWIWSTWAHLVLGLVIAAEVMAIYAAMIFIVPKFRELVGDRLIDAESRDEVGHFNAWAFDVLRTQAAWAEQGWWILLGLVVVWALFEWRVKSENKAFMRLSGMGTAAAALFAVILWMGVALIIPPLIMLPAVEHGLAAERTVRDERPKIDPAVMAMERALAREDWPEADRQAAEAQRAVMRLWGVPEMLEMVPEAKARVESFRRNWSSAAMALRNVREAAGRRDKAAAEEAVKRFETVYAAAARLGAETQPGQ